MQKHIRRPGTKHGKMSACFVPTPHPQRVGCRYKSRCVACVKKVVVFWAVLVAMRLDNRSGACVRCDVVTVLSSHADIRCVI